MTTTSPEAAIEAATRAGEGGARYFDRPNGAPLIRITGAPGGYFVEAALGGGRYWRPRAFALTASAIGADDIPEHVWAERAARAADQAEAWGELRARGIDVRTPVGDFEDHEDAEVRLAARTLLGLRYLLVWPADEVAAHIEALREQWEA